MECHIEQVLYRDQRTIKTRFFDVAENQNHQPCLSCQSIHVKPPLSTKTQRFHRSLSQNHHRQEPACSKLLNSDDAFSIHDGVSISNSSLDNYKNCHNQYLSNKRLLLRTDNECQCDDVKFSRVSEGRRKGVTTSWFKKLQNVLLLSTYLSLLTLPNTHAHPAMCNRPNETEGFWVKPCDHDFESPIGEPPNEMNVTSMNIVNNSARSAFHYATDLKAKYRNYTINVLNYSDPEKTYSTVPGYEWLPQIQKFSSDEEFEQHVQVHWQETLLTLYRHLQTISVPLEQLIVDMSPDDHELYGNFTNMRGHIKNVLCELRFSIHENNIKVINDVSRNIMPDKLRNLCRSKSDQASRDWMIIREIVNVLNYTLDVCNYLAKGRN